MMSRKSGAGEGPMHSRLGRHHAMKRKKNKDKTQQNNQKPNKQKQKQQCTKGCNVIHTENRDCLTLNGSID